MGGVKPALRSVLGPHFSRGWNQQFEDVWALRQRVYHLHCMFFPPQKTAELANLPSMNKVFIHTYY